MPELDAGTQGAGGYCKEVYQWILRNWNAEIPCIIGTPRPISVPSRLPDSGRVGAPTVPRRSTYTSSAEIFICRRAHRTLLTTVVTARSDNVFVEKRRSEDC